MSPPRSRLRWRTSRSPPCRTRPRTCRLWSADCSGPSNLSPVVHEAEDALELVAVARLVVVAEDLGERVPAHRSEDDMSAAGPWDLHGVVAVAGEGRDHALGHVGVLAAAGAAAHRPHPRRLARLRHLPLRQPRAVIHGDLV